MSVSARQDNVPSASAHSAWAVDHWVLDQLYRLVGNPPISLQLQDGYRTGDLQSEVTIRFNDRGALYRALYKPTYSFGVLFTANRISVKGDLVLAMERIYEGLSSVRTRGGPLAQLARRMTARKPRTNSPRLSRDNIHTHYDLGNDFYRLWLDKAHMQYTCAYFAAPHFTLEQAQAAKLELVCRKLTLQPGESVVEAGGGWGGLALYLARNYGVKVRSYNISAAQVAYARQRARAEGLHDYVEYIEDDYRNIRGRFDVFVSVGMLEHVGPSNFIATGDTIDRCLKDDGRGFIHTIGQISPRLLNEWIERNIFPGAQPPSLQEMMEIFEPRGFCVRDVENLRPHYARTLRDWITRFDQHRSDIEAMFDPTFVRAWRLYLCGSAAAFSAGDLQLFQVLFARPGCDKLPDTREHLFHKPLLAGRPND